MNAYIRAPNIIYSTILKTKHLGKHLRLLKPGYTRWRPMSTPSVYSFGRYLTMARSHSKESTTKQLKAKYACNRAKRPCCTETVKISSKCRYLIPHFDRKSLRLHRVMWNSWWKAAGTLIQRRGLPWGRCSNYCWGAFVEAYCLGTRWTRFFF